MTPHDIIRWDSVDYTALGALVIGLVYLYALGAL